MELTPALPKSLTKQDLPIIIHLISQRWGVAVEYITPNSHFSDDLGLDCLDIIELTILIEQQFADLTVADDARVTSVDGLIQNIHLADDASNKDAEWCRQQLAI
jgi:acyl carrier protein